MELTRQNSMRLQPGQPTVRLGAPLYLRVAIALLVIMLALVAGVTRFAKNDPLLSNPFTTYLDVLPGQTIDGILLGEFSCVIGIGPGSDQNQTKYCQRTLTAGVFSHVGLIMSSRGVISRLELTVRPNALDVGALAILWGRPEVHLYGNSANIAWPDRGITAMGWSENERFSYFLPLQSIAFYGVRAR